MASWLYGAAWKTASDIRRKNSRRRLDETEQAKDQIALVVSSDDSPLETIAIRHDNETLDRQLSLLSEKYRMPLVLFYFAGMTIKQISQRLGISVSATEGRLKRGKSKLRTRLAGQGMPFSSVLLATVLNTGLQPNTELIAATCQQCATTTTSSLGLLPTDTFSILSGNINAGTRIMICKTVCSIAIVTMAAIGGYLHSEPTGHADATQVTLQVSEGDRPGDQIQVVSPQSQSACCADCDPECCSVCGPICDTVCDVINEPLCHSVCDHLRLVHDKIFAHTCDLFHSLHGR